MFGSLLYTPTDRTTPIWPDIRSIKGLGKSVLAVAQYPAGVLFADFITLTPAKDFDASVCPREEPEAEITALYGCVGWEGMGEGGRGYEGMCEDVRG